jgi:hypothetical protein
VKDNSTPGIQADKHHITQDPPHGLEGGRRLEDCRKVGADEKHDHGRRQHVFDVLGNAGDKTTPRTEGRAGKGIGAACVRQGRAHLGD